MSRDALRILFGTEFDYYLRFPSVSKSSKWTTRCWTCSLWWPGCPIEMGCLRRLVYAVLSMYTFHGRWIYKAVWYECALLCSIWALFEVSWWVNWGWKRCDMTGNTMQYFHALRAVPSKQLGSNETLSSRGLLLEVWRVCLMKIPRLVKEWYGKAFWIFDRNILQAFGRLCIPPDPWLTATSQPFVVFMIDHGWHMSHLFIQ